jgi:hypothetical protein
MMTRSRKLITLNDKDTFQIPEKDGNMPKKFAKVKSAAKGEVTYQKINIQT